MKTPPLSRRTFIKSAGAAGLSVSFAILLPGCDSRSNSAVRDTKTETDLLSWVVIQPDNSAVIRIPQTELGQGVTTTLAQVIADELELDWSYVSSEYYDPRENAAHENVFVWTTTLGSSSAHYLFAPARTAAAQIKAKLIAVAALRLKVPNHELLATKSYVVHRPSKRKLSYADIADEAAGLVLPEDHVLDLKPAAKRRLIGESLPQFDLSKITSGAKQFGIDIELPNMRHAIAQQSPVYGGKLLSFDDRALAELPGNPKAFRIDGAIIGYNSPVPEGGDPDLWAAEVRSDDAVAIVADSWWQAKVALDALQVRWSDSVHNDFSSESLTKSLEEKVQDRLPISAQHGDFDTAIGEAEKKLLATYTYPFMDPAPMEPMNCTALFDGDEIHVWTNSQYPDDAWRIAYQLAGVEPNNAHLHLMPAGGGFGRRLHNDFVHQAVQLAHNNAGMPIKLLATREESTKHSYYAPLTVARFEAGLSAEDEVVAWNCRVASGYSPDQSYGATRIPFTIPHTRFEYERDKGTPVPFGWMRGVGFTQHLWMNYSFLDELRLITGRDAVDFFRAHLDPERIPTDLANYDLAVDRAEKTQQLLDFCIEKGKWGLEKRPGVGRGICVSDSSYYAGYESSTKAAIVDVTLDDAGFPTIERVFVAIEAGTIINPDVVHAQLEGGVAYALTSALFSEITVEGGKVQQSNFHDYPMLKMDRMPPVEIAILASSGSPLSVGEDAVPITIAALVNAIADAGGSRVRSLPISASSKPIER
jgi:isoquinoline 1-oxidoreductase subunit beta